MECTFEGPPIDDPSILEELPADIVQSLRDRNGFVLNEGAFHVRGACSLPVWHSLREAWHGKTALHRLFPAVKITDIPIAQDCFGDQYLIRDGRVIRLSGEMGETEEMRLDWKDFFGLILSKPNETLQLQHFYLFQENGGALLPGELLSVYPPFVATYDGNRFMRPISALERISWLADFASQIRDIPNGTQIKIKVL